MTICLVFSNVIRSQSYFGTEADLVFNSLYGFNLSQSDSIVRANRASMQDTAVWNLLSANVSWMEILAGNMESPVWNAQFEKNIKASKRNLKENGIDEDDRLFYYIIVHAFKTRHELLNDNYINAANDLNTCVDQISESFGREDEYEPFYLTSGLYYYFMAKAHQDYLLMRPYLMFYPDGDMKKGLDYLGRLTTSSDIFLRNESNYFLMRIYYDLEKDFERALRYANNLVVKNPQNLIYRLYLIKILRALESDQLTDMEAIFASAVNSNVDLNSEQKKHFLEQLNSDE